MDSVKFGNPEPAAGMGPALGPESSLECRRSLEHLLAALTAILLCVGVQMVQSASLTSRPSRLDELFLTRHLMWIGVATTAAWGASRLTADVLERHARTLFWCFALLIAVVLIPGIGTRINGAQRWIRFAGLSLQPSELGRLILPMVAAAEVLRQKRSGPMTLDGLPRTLLPLLISIPLVAAEPDLGAAVFLTIAFLLALFFAGWPLRYFALCGLLLIPAAAGLLVLRPYQLQRITGFLETWQNPAAAPWQIRQSLLSLGSGGLQGTGIGRGWQKLSYLPEANTDFVFAVIGEELGLIGTLTVCFVWIVFFFTGRSVLAHLPRNSFAWIVGTTLLTQLVLQAMANIAVAVALVPPKGVPHPLVSYGGTNLLVSLSAVGFVLGLARSGPSGR
ncbi:MAG: putative peptidoglycan glycosyltransferase FtsW [Planctomycetota bacterium]